MGGGVNQCTVFARFFPLIDACDSILEDALSALERIKTSMRMHSTAWKLKQAEREGREECLSCLVCVYSFMVTLNPKP